MNLIGFVRHHEALVFQQMETFFHCIFVFLQGLTFLFILNVILQSMQEDVSSVISLRKKKFLLINEFGGEFSVFFYLETLIGRVAEQLVEGCRLALLSGVVVQDPVGRDGSAVCVQPTVGQQGFRVQHLGHGYTMSKSFVHCSNDCKKACLKRSAF